MPSDRYPHEWGGDGWCRHGCGTSAEATPGQECPVLLRAALDAATRDHSRPLVGVTFGAWERCDNGACRYDVRGYPASQAVMALGVGLDSDGLPVVTWEIAHPDTGVVIGQGASPSTAVAVERMYERAEALGWDSGMACEPCPRCGVEPCDCGGVWPARNVEAEEAEPARDVEAEAKALGWWNVGVRGCAWTAERLYRDSSGVWWARNALGGPLWHPCDTEADALAYAIDHREVADGREVVDE